MRRSILLILLFLGSSAFLQANNIQVSNVYFEAENPNQGEYLIYFDIAWENSWRTSTYEANYDAAWVFAKYRTSPEQPWYPVELIGFASGPSDAEIVVPSDNVGLFVQRSSNGVGDVNFGEITMSWYYPSAQSDLDNVEICVFAIEMVYIPEGPFYVGDGSGYAGMFRAGNSSDPFLITSENQLTLGGTSIANLSPLSGLVYPDDFNSATTRTLPAAFPKGYQAFYAMKYEISQGQYADFLSNISATEASLRYDQGSYAVDGQSIKLSGLVSGLQSRYRAESPNRAANYLNWVDIATYSDWAGLRPMSELEFEKICRGPIDPVPLEYAWGNTAIHYESYHYEDDAETGGVILDPGEGIGNAIYNNTSSGTPVPSGPADCGVFSKSIANPTRQESGASFYGVMEMSGNVAERVVSISNPEGRSLQATAHGNGTTNSGVATWPAVTGSNIGLGTGFKGAHFTNYEINLAVSARYDVGFSDNVGRFAVYGGRLVRSNF